MATVTGDVGIEESSAVSKVRIGINIEDRRAVGQSLDPVIDGLDVRRLEIILIAGIFLGYRNDALQNDLGIRLQLTDTVDKAGISLDQTAGGITTLINAQADEYLTVSLVLQ